MKKIIFLLLVLFIGTLLRIYQLGGNPPGFSWDEASLGYNAYSILTSGHDEHGELFPLARFIAFGDYKPPGFIYAAVPSISLFGLNEFAVRLPSAIAGIAMILFSYLLVKELFKREKLALLTGLILAISPWAVHFSRAAYEANLAAAFNLLGVYFFILSGRKKSMLILSVVFFILSFYTFNANRIIAPLILSGLSLIYIKKLLSNIKWVIISIFLAILMLLPSVSYLTNRESRLRFQEVSIFNDLSPLESSNKRINVDGNTWWSKLIHNRRLLFASNYLEHYFDNFSGRFLFTHGDANPRLSVGGMGEFYVWDIFFLPIGIYWLIRNREKSIPVLLLWLLAAPIPAATARETPHALRILSILPAFQILIAYGLYQLVINIKKYSDFTTSDELSNHPRNIFRVYNFLLFAICFLLTVNFYYYLHNYYIHYPITYSGEWQYGYRQMVDYVREQESNYDYIFVTNALGRPYIYFAFYNQYSNNDFINIRKASRDWYGFWTVHSLGKIKFGFDEMLKTYGKKLIVATPGEISESLKTKKIIKDIEGRTVFSIYSNQ